MINKDLFEEYVHLACHYNDMSDKYINKICEILLEESPSNNIWYFRDGFFRVDVVKEDYEKYMNFIEEIIGCSYCYSFNDTGLTFMVSLTTIDGKL